jgi:hypothetical protein
MSVRTRQLVASLEDSGVAYSHNFDVGEVIDPGSAEGDKPVIEIHGPFNANDPTIEEIRKGLNADAVDALKVGTGQMSYESQQQDSDIAKQEEARAQAEAELQEGQDALADNDAIRTDIKKVFVLKGADPTDDLDNGIHATFTALTQSMLDDPEHTVAAFLPVDASSDPGHHAIDATIDTRQNLGMKAVLAENGVPFVTSVESLCEYLNGWVSNKHAQTVISTEGFPVKLRVGQPVKYSHGEGKIQKICTAPIKFNGELHHCSKEKPKYLVKANHGNHLSLHHASALRPM